MLLQEYPENLMNRYYSYFMYFNTKIILSKKEIHLPHLMTVFNLQRHE